MPPHCLHCKKRKHLKHTLLYSEQLCVEVKKTCEKILEEFPGQVDFLVPKNCSSTVRVLIRKLAYAHGLGDHWLQWPRIFRFDFYRLCYILTHPCTCMPEHCSSPVGGENLFNRPSLRGFPLLNAPPKPDGSANLWPSKFQTKKEKDWRLRLHEWRNRKIAKGDFSPFATNRREGFVCARQGEQVQRHPNENRYIAPISCIEHIPDVRGR